ncbi:unnamed protein product [Rotaria sp. Silwood1]|nr:unnamed protein product [Rotaria sp. Silwood1]CAF4985193.1 unnamed protein product [Rotaria sp. Silwood1]
MTNIITKFCFIVGFLLVFVELSQSKWIKPHDVDIRSRSYNRTYHYPCTQFKTITQNIDHFGFVNTDTYQQRYILNTDHWKHGKPIFFYTGNEGDIDHFCEHSGFIWEIAQIFHAMVVFAEHRYYGASLPYGNASFSSPAYTRYLTSGQALADYAYLLRYIHSSIIGAEKSPVVAFGGSYGGMLAAYFRMKYSHLVVGAHASSAPVFMLKAHCELFSRAKSSQCVDIIRSSWSAINRIGSNSAGLTQLTNLFKLCHPLRTVDELKKWLITMYDNIAIYDYPYPTSFISDLPGFPARAFCAHVTSPSLGTTINDEEIVRRIAKGTNVYFNNSGHVECLNTGSQDPPRFNLLAWSYQSCTEGFLAMCPNGIDDMFERQTFDFQAYSDKCYAQWGVRPRPEWSYLEYGGNDVTDFRYHSNIVFTNGNLDPWIVGGLLTQVAPRLPVIFIEGAAHHLDLRGANRADPPSVRKAREKIIALIKKWIS